MFLQSCSNEENKSGDSLFSVCSLPVSLNLQDTLQKKKTDCFAHTPYILIFKIMSFTDVIFFHDSLPQSFIYNTIFGKNALPPFKAPFIVSLRYFENSDTRSSPRTRTVKFRAISSNHCYLIQERLRII